MEGVLAARQLNILKALKTLIGLGAAVNFHREDLRFLGFLGASIVRLEQRVSEADSGCSLSKRFRVFRLSGFLRCLIGALQSSRFLGF